MKKNAVWITGASSGIGEALSKIYANNNHQVIGTSRNNELLRNIKNEMINPDNFIYYENDVTNSSEVVKIADQIRENYKINCLINNAGVTSFKPFIENKISDIDDIIKTNLNGSIYTIKSVLPEMINDKSGTIINILSVAAKKIFSNSSIYAASKAGLELFSKVLREEVREHNIKIINIYPGATSTEIWPDSTLNKFSDKMMTSMDLAELIFNIQTKSLTLCPEEIVVRPITGDL